MTRISRSHPRYASLQTRSRLAAASRRGLVVPEGLIAQGRAEAFDYLLGERTSPSARRAIRAAAGWLVRARRPVLSVNGNVAALAPREVADVVRALPGLQVEVNLFHRTPRRVRLVEASLKRVGITPVLGLRPTVRVPGLDSDRGRVDAGGIAVADVVVIPLEDGDRAEALRRWGKRVIAIDLNPLSRTARTADLPIVDEVQRALTLLAQSIRKERRRSRPRGRFSPFDASGARAAALTTMAKELRRSTATMPPRPSKRGRASPRPAPGSAGRIRRRP
ncbi:MAG: phosphopantothenate/pantothenate synthetase [Thermoplasmata archaeon]